jgi:hypothetical protein
LTFSDWDGKRFVPARILTEIDFDPDKKTISSFYKGRGIGDCGSTATWSWTGSEFKLKDYFFKENATAGPSAASAAGGFSRAGNRFADQYGVIATGAAIRGTASPFGPMAICEQSP